MRVAEVPLAELARWAATLCVTKDVPEDAMVNVHVLARGWELRVEGQRPFELPYVPEAEREVPLERRGDVDANPYGDFT